MQETRDVEIKLHSNYHGLNDGKSFIWEYEENGKQENNTHSCHTADKDTALDKKASSKIIKLTKM